MRRFTAIAASALSLAIASTALVASGQAASAYTGTPPWVAGDSASIKGSVLVLDAAGARVTSGSNIKSIGGYLATSAAARVGASFATATVAAPDPTNAIPSTWATNTLPTTNFDFTAGVAPSGAPAGAAYVALSLSGANVPARASALTLYAGADAAYLHILELRIQDSGSGIADDGLYFRTVIEYNPNALGGADYDGLAPQGWRQLYPVPSGPSTIATATTTPTSNPSGSQVVGTSITFSTTVAPASGSLTGGTVQFLDGVTPIGADKPLSGTATNGSAVTITADPWVSSGVATHQIKAVYTPSNSAFGSSQSSTLAVIITSTPVVADATSTTIASTVPSGTASTSDSVTVNVHVSDTDNVGTIVAAGSVVLKAGGTAVAQGNVDGSGNFSSSFVAGQYLALGTNNLTAEYTGTAAFANSVTAGPTVYTVTLAVPGNIVLPSAGAARVGVVSTCNPGSWQAAFAYSYEWFQRANAAGSWALFSTSRSTTALPPGYAGHQVKCKVTAYNPGSASAESPTIVVALGAASRVVTKPKIVGTPLVGRKLTASRGVWSPAATSYLYVWKVGSVIVSRATTFTPSAKYKGKSLVLVISALRAGYLTGTAASGAVRIR
jgi:hypothetical protein